MVLYPRGQTFSEIILTNSAPIAEITKHFSITKINWIRLFREIITVYLQNHVNSIYTLCVPIADLLSVKTGGMFIVTTGLERVKRKHCEKGRGNFCVVCR
jgi:hypothetical protein